LAILQRTEREQLYRAKPYHNATHIHNEMDMDILDPTQLCAVLKANGADEEVAEKLESK
jgi:hypothetical protein